MHPRRLAPALVAVLLLAGCGPGLKEQLVGKWSYSERTRDGKTEFWYEFHADGTVARGGTLQVLSGEGAGAYRVVDADTVELDFEGRKEWYKVSVAGDTLKLLDADGRLMEFSREE